MKKIIILLILSSCASPNLENSQILDFNRNLSFEEFNKLVDKYVEINPYPDIDK